MKLRSMASSALVLSALVMGGCQSSRFGTIDTGPEPVAAAPAGVVQQSQLPPPSKPQGAAAVDPSQFPAAPTTPAAPAAPAAGTQVASAATAAAPSGPDLTVASVVGGWRASGATDPCQMMISQTKTGSNFRAAPRKCTGDLQKLSSWRIAGKQLTLFDDGGNEIARLYSSGGGFSGQTSGGSAISLTR